jgi:dTDP-4-dehydrorhamnose reductase
MTDQQRIAQLENQVSWLMVNIQMLCQRIGVAPVTLSTLKVHDGRTETGMGPIVSPDKSSFV